MQSLKIKIPSVIPGNDAQVEDKRQFLANLVNYQDTLIFSAHLDDAVLSMGSLIAQLVAGGTSVTVITVFTKGSNLNSPLIQKLITQAGFATAEDYFEARRIEDQKALEVMGNIENKHLGFVDAAWRQTEAGKSLYPETTLNVVNQHDEQQIPQLEKTFQKLVTSPEKTIIFAPLGSGKHVDHILVRDVCASMFSHIIFYADFPYSQSYKNEDAFIHNKQLEKIIWTGNYYQQKADAILAYETQKKSLFKDEVLQLPYEEFYIDSKLKLGLRQK